ncbi:hypothetical protein GTY84_19705 [Streptomyces sp. SID8352]|nr:hypothetical protein [Streptomyces sp. SID8352]
MRSGGPGAGSGSASSARAGGRRVSTEISGGGPGYDETAKMFAEAAPAPALDDLPRAAGQVTAAVAMGDALTSRLTAAGIGFRPAAVRRSAALPPL